MKVKCSILRFLEEKSYHHGFQNWNEDNKMVIPSHLPMKKKKEKEREKSIFIKAVRNFCDRWAVITNVKCSGSMALMKSSQSNCLNLKSD